MADKGSLIPKGVKDFGSELYDNVVGGGIRTLKDAYKTSTSPATEPGGNVINDMATSMWHAAGRESKKADDFARAAQNSHSLGEWASNTSQGLGHLGGVVLPAAADAGVDIGNKEYGKGFGKGVGLIAATAIGGAKTKFAKDALEGAEAATSLKGALPKNVVEMPTPLEDVKPYTGLMGGLHKAAGAAQDFLDNRALKKAGSLRQASMSPEAMSAADDMRAGVRREQFGVHEGGTPKPVGTNNPDAMAYRVRSVGEEGIPHHPLSRAQATTSLQEAQSYVPGREELAGHPQEVVGVPMDHLPGFSMVPGPNQASWLKVHSPVPESVISKPASLKLAAETK